MYEAFKKLIRRYEEITREEIGEAVDKRDGYILTAKEDLTGFGSTAKCILCKQTRQFPFNSANCLDCDWMKLTDFKCDKGSNSLTYKKIGHANTIEELYQAYKDRAEYMKIVLEENGKDFYFEELEEKRKMVKPFKRLMNTYYNIREKDIRDMMDTLGEEKPSVFVKEKLTGFGSIKECNLCKYSFDQANIEEISSANTLYNYVCPHCPWVKITGYKCNEVYNLDSYNWIDNANTVNSLSKGYDQRFSRMSKTLRKYKEQNITFELGDKFYHKYSNNKNMDEYILCIKDRKNKTSHLIDRETGNTWSDDSINKIKNITYKDLKEYIYNDINKLYIKDDNDKLVKLLDVFNEF